MSDQPNGTLLADLGVDPSAIVSMEAMPAGHESRLFRVRTADGSYVLKCFPDSPDPTEIAAYSLLARLGVPTLKVHGRTRAAILLDDLRAGGEWRLATEDDLASRKVGEAVADWYRTLHAAGRALLADEGGWPPFLHRETDPMTSASIAATGRTLGLDGNPDWQLAVQSVDALVAAARALPETLTYNDFHWSNLALSVHAPMRAVVFDYHLLGVAYAYGDVRNVLSCMQGPGAEAFRECCGQADEREVVLDGPISVLFALQEAASRASLPGWAAPLVERVTAGDFGRGLRAALESLRQM